MRRFMIGLVAVFAAMPLSMFGAAADGMSHVYVPEYDTWELASEDSQFAMISHVDGIENLVIQASIDYEDLRAGAKAVWFFPIPSDPNDANITIVRTMESLGGYFVSSLAEREVDRNFVWVYGSQLYPLLALGATGFRDGVWYGGSRLMLTDDAEDDSWSLPSVVISEHVEAFGMASELVSADDATALGQYIADKGLVLGEDALILLDGYVGEQYSFVASWIQDVDDFMNESQIEYGYYGRVYKLGVSVSFPTERMYYPLKLTSIYGDRSVPMVIQVLGRGTPVRFQHEDEQALMEAYRCMDPDYYVSLSNAWFFRNELTARNLQMGTLQDVEFTVISMEGPSSYLAEDLWIESGWDTGVADFVYHNSWVVIVAALAGASVLASLSAGWTIYRPFGPDLRLFAALGLMNLLTLVGMVVGVYVFDVERKFMRPNTERMVWHRRKDFLFAFTLIFLGYSLLIHLAAVLVL